MKRCADYIAEAKTALGNPKMSDRELGEHLGGYKQPVVAMAKSGAMSDPFALKIAEALGVAPGEVLMVARLEREKDPAVRAALESWAGNVFSLLPKMAASTEVVRGGRRVSAVGRNP